MSNPARIDAHHHLWHYSAEEYGWIDEPMRAIQRDFTPSDLLHAMQGAKIDGAIAVQARETLEETRWLLECARTNAHIVGVVGWAPLESPSLGATLDALAHPHLCGLREVLQGKPIGFLDSETLDPGIRILTQRRLAFDLLIRAEQLPETIRLVDRHPAQTFILDHAAKPHIVAGELEPWRTQITDLAKRPNVSCKLSGLVTEADWAHPTLDTLSPYLDTCVDAFTPSRLLAGSDWPVCLVAASYSEWWQMLETYLSDLSATEQQLILGTNAATLYKLGRES